MSIEQTPIVVLNPDQRYSTDRATFYMLFIDDWKGADCRGNSYLTDSMDWAFSDNQLLFLGYLRFYNVVLKDVIYHTEIYEDCTWKEFSDKVQAKHGYQPNAERFILVSAEPVSDTIVFYTEGLYTEYSASCGEVDYFREELRYDIAGGIPFLKSGYFKSNPDIDILCKLLSKYCKVYLLIDELINTWYERDEDGYSEEWGNHLPDYFVQNLNRCANFSVPVENLQYYDIINDIYLLYRFVQICIEDAVHDDGPKGVSTV